MRSSTTWIWLSTVESNLRPMLTHSFRLEQWRDAFLAFANQGDSDPVKVAQRRRDPSVEHAVMIFSNAS